MLIATVVLTALASTTGQDLGRIQCFKGPYLGALAKASAEGKMVFVAFWTKDSDWCDKLVRDTFSDPSAAAALNDFVCLSVDLTRGPDGRLIQPQSENVSRRFPVRVFPSLFFVAPDGTVEDIISGYIPPAAFVSEVQRVRSGTSTRTDLEAQVRRAPQDIAARLALAQKLSDLGDQRAHDEQLAAIRELDPDETSLPMQQRNRERITEAMVAQFDDEKGLYETKPLEEWLANEAKHSEVLFSGWGYLADLNWRLDRFPQSRQAYAAAWEHVQANQVFPFGSVLAARFWQGRDELTRVERSLALEAALRAAEQAELAAPGPEVHAACLDALACSYFMNDQRQQALETIERCIELDGANQAYAVRLEAFKLRR